jgi:hypothetical protein
MEFKVTISILKGCLVCILFCNPLLVVAREEVEFGEVECPLKVSLYLGWEKFIPLQVLGRSHFRLLMLFYFA